MAKTKKLGDLVNQTISTNAPLSGGANLTDVLNFSITKADTTTDGYVSATDWNIFNNKQDALGFTPYNATNPDGYISGITTGMVTTALGFTPYDSANPDGYITSSALSGLVPYTGATANVDLGTHSLTASDLIIDHASGSGVAASITKGGNGEALTVVKSSGSGNVASFTGGNTFISTLTTPTINGVSGNLAFANAVQTSGAITAFTFTKPNNTTQTASTQINGFVVNGGTRQWNTGNIGTQSENVWGATTYSFAGASTITNAYGNVFNAPIAGTNCTITNNWAAQFNGQIQVTGNIINVGGQPNIGTTTAPYGTFYVTNIRAGADMTFGAGYGTSGDRALIVYATTRNVLIQNGGTFADAGFRLDVNGTGRFQNTLTLATGTTTIAPLKLIAGTNLTTPVNGSFEFDGTNLYFTVGGIRKIVTLI
jgi:hypothetical protein